jgi:voltage-gated potassium channel
MPARRDTPALTAAERLAVGRPRTLIAALAGFTALASVIGGFTANLLAPEVFTGFGESVWWALQTFTTVGYGDVVPDTSSGRLVASAVMLAGLAAVSVFTALVTAVFIDARTRQLAAEDQPGQTDTIDALHAIEARLAAIERSLADADR